MAGGYTHTPKDIDAIVRRLRSMQRQIDELRGKAGINSSVVQGRILIFRSPDGDDIVKIGDFNANTPPALRRGLDVLDDDGNYLIHAVTKLDTGTEVVQFGNSLGGGGHTIEDFFILSDVVNIGESGYDVEKVRIYSPEVGLYDLVTTSNSANVHLGTVGAVWTLARVTSSARYKTDIDKARIDPRDVLKLTPRTWVDKVDAEAAGKPIAKDASRRPVDGRTSDLADGSDHSDQAVGSNAAEGESVESAPFVPPRHTGFIAEDLDALPSMRQFLRYDANGEPDAIDYERLPVALVELCKAQQVEIDSLKSTIDDLGKRLSALEGRRA